MYSGPRSSLASKFALVGGAVPLALTIMHLVRQQPFGPEDAPFWPASLLLIGAPVATFPGVALFALATVLNVAWYALLGLAASLIGRFLAGRFRR